MQSSRAQRIRFRHRRGWAGADRRGRSHRPARGHLGRGPDPLLGGAECTSDEPLNPAPLTIASNQEIPWTGPISRQDCRPTPRPRARRSRPRRPSRRPPRRPHRPRAGTRLGGARRTIATALLAGGLLTVGGVAVAFAADPSRHAGRERRGAVHPGRHHGSGHRHDATPARRRPARHRAGRQEGRLPDKAGGGTTTPSPDASTAPTTPTPDPTVIPDPTATPSAEL